MTAQQIDVHGLPAKAEVCEQLGEYAVMRSTGTGFHCIGVFSDKPSADNLAREWNELCDRLEAALRQSGEAVVAFRLLYKTHSGEWSAQGRPWVDGKPDPKLVADATVPASRWKIEYAFAAPPATSGLVVDDEMVFRMAMWMALHDGNDDPHYLIWEGIPPQPWGEVWNKYEDDARAALTAALAARDARGEA